MTLAWWLTAERLHADERIAQELTERVVAAVTEPAPWTYIVDYQLCGETRCALITTDEAEAVARAVALSDELLAPRIVVMQGRST